MAARRWNSRSWVSLSPNGLGHQKPQHYADILRAVWANRGRLGYAWRILSRGVCDGCALGSAGLRDWTMSSPHLCSLRLSLLRMNTMPALDPALLADVQPLRERSGNDLHALGRLPCPLVRHRGEPGFRRATWDEALSLVGQQVRRTAPKRLAFFTTSRGITNETYYTVQKVARFLGTNNVDNSARLCHAPSVTALQEALGVAAATCSYRDWIGTDLLVFLGSDVANNQPVATKYIYLARQAGTRVVVVNPVREPGLERYWIPSIAESALFGTRLTDEFFQVHTGGDLAFLNGVLKSLIESDDVDHGFIARHAAGWEELTATLARQGWRQLEQEAGAPRREMERLAQLYARARSAVFVWSMGITQHVHGVENVRAIINLALARGMIGREKCGLMPLRGHSGVQGGCELGCAPDVLPGGEPLVGPAADRIAAEWGFAISAGPGISAAGMVSAASRGDLDLLYCIGGNFLENLPDRRAVAAGLARVAMRVHQDIVLSSAMLVDPAETVVLLPAETRYETAGGTTETTTERRILFSPEIPGPRISEARPEWQIPLQVAQQAFPERRHLLDFADVAAVRGEIARVCPTYAGIEHLSRPGDMVQWGGSQLCGGGQFPTASGYARFAALDPTRREIPPGFFILSTRRGKQLGSMVQGRRDPLTGAGRDAVLIAAADAAVMALKEGDRVLVESESGQLICRYHPAPLRPQNVQVFWPEGNVLLGRGQVEPQSGRPDYHTLVRITPLDRAAPVQGRPERERARSVPRDTATAGMA